MLCRRLFSSLAGAVQAASGKAAGASGAPGKLDALQAALRAGPDLGAFLGGKGQEPGAADAACSPPPVPVATHSPADEGAPSAERAMHR
jgi:hypothetical protein